MAKKKGATKKKRSNGPKKQSLPRPSLSLPSIELPESAKRLIMSTLMFAVAVIFVFAFFEMSGAAGGLLTGVFGYLIGNTVFLIPLLLIITGLIFMGMEEWNPSPVLFSLFLLIVGVNGLIGVFAEARGLSVVELSGVMGSWVASFMTLAFGFWVGGILFAVLAGVGVIILWQLLPRLSYSEDDESFGANAQQRIKKIFEPKFEVSELEPEQQEVKEEPKEEEDKDEAKIAPTPEPALGNFRLPPVDLLEKDKGAPSAGDINKYSATIKKAFQNFDIPVEVSEVNTGPAVTQYAIKPAEGIKLTRITALANDLALALAAHPIRMEAPIPGKALVGIEIPNKSRAAVHLRGLIDSPDFKKSSTPLNLAMGKDVSGNAVYGDLGKMPHVLVAGATGSGKTIALHNIILSLLYRNSPMMMRFILVDPKRVEFPVFNDLPHLLTPVIYDTQKTINALKWLIKEMERRFQVFSDAKARDIATYHSIYAKSKPNEMESVPYIVVIIDELADLMAARGKEMEGMIVRLAQMARAVGIHLVLATQRPSVEVITGLIKANVTARVAFQVASQVDSRTILDMAGAERLLGQGDMLFLSSDFSKPRRLQGAFVSDTEVRKVVEFVSKEGQGFDGQEIREDDLSQAANMSVEMPDAGEADEDDDPMYEQAKQIVLETRKASTSYLQRRLRLGYARAARLVDLLEERGVVGPAEGSKPREIYGESEAPKDGSDDDDGFYTPKIG